MPQIIITNIQPQREIIDVEYEDITEEVNDQKELKEKDKDE